MGTSSQGLGSVRVNMDSSVRTDIRFRLVAGDLGIPFKELIGCLFLVWLNCYERRSERLTKREADAAAEQDGFSEAMIAHGLADDRGDRVAFHGAKKRIKFLRDQKERGKKGGQKSAESRRLKSKESAAPIGAANGEPNASPTAQANTPAPTPDLALTPTPSDKNTQRAPARESHPKFDFEAVYQLYPLKRGKKNGLEKCRKLIKTQEGFDAFRAAVETMAKTWQGQGTQYCPHFSTFVNQEMWLDGELPQPKSNDRTPRPTKPGEYTAPIRKYDANSRPERPPR